MLISVDPAVPEGPRKAFEQRETCPLLLTAKQAAAICSKSLRTWRTWDSAGLIPLPVRIGRSVHWRSDELAAWVRAGCPRRADWHWEPHL
jgi:predicted DNA-binding transcriptional regulator AlpA